MKTPQVGNSVRVADQSSQYRGLTGTITASLGNEMYAVKLANHHTPVLLRFTQLTLLSGGGSLATPTPGNDPGRDNHALVTPTPSVRRDTLGGGFNPHSAQGTLGDSRVFQVANKPTPGAPMGRHIPA